MIDTEKSLLLPVNYFNRYREFLHDGLRQTEAWEAVERELEAQIGLRKFTTIDGLRHALANEWHRKTSGRVYFSFPRKR